MAIDLNVNQNAYRVNGKRRVVEVRKVLLAATITAGIALAVTGAVLARPERENLLQKHQEKLQALAYCEKGYEIASSFPAYASSKAKDPAVRERLVAQADVLTHRLNVVTKILNTSARDEAISLGVPIYMYESMLAEYRKNAELAAVRAFQAVDDPAFVINRLNDICNEHLTI